MAKIIDFETKKKEIYNDYDMSVDDLIDDEEVDDIMENIFGDLDSIMLSKVLVQHLTGEDFGATEFEKRLVKKKIDDAFTEFIP